jgi:hypothetical protein
MLHESFVELPGRVAQNVLKADMSAVGEDAATVFAAVEGGRLAIGGTVRGMSRLAGRSPGIPDAAPPPLSEQNPVWSNYGIPLPDIASFEFKGLKAQRILVGSGGKIAIIGRTMGNEQLPGVRDYAKALRGRGVDIEVFDGDKISAAARREFAELTRGGRRLTNQELLKTKMYQENKAWAESLKANGYTVIDLGNPYPKKFGFSPFYSMEKKTIFSGGQ